MGLTHRQEQIMRMNGAYYDRVLPLTQQTASAPPERRFKWTCETAWQVRHYLSQRPERLGELVALAQAGLIEITAGYFPFTDPLDLDASKRKLEWTLEFFPRHALPLRSVVHSDINCWPW